MVANKVEQRKKREPPDKGNRTQSEHSGAEHNAPEQAVIVLCGTDPSASQQALHDEWAWHDYIPHPRPPSSTSSSSSHAFFSSSPACLPLPLALLLSLPSFSLSPHRPQKPHSIQPLPCRRINLHSGHLVLVLCSDTMTYYSAWHTY
ncbi:hypothetical protein GOODEAATRI_000572 [Goodea atripinnis]|uniref:Arginine vasotocin receptor n=1 Tax=Goodea atripinnis TaxID=208336 RepID=A0ABV0PK00_9TELE